MLPDDLLVRRDLKQSAADRLENQRVAAVKSLAVGGDAGEEAVGVVVHPHQRVVGPGAAAGPKDIVDTITESGSAAMEAAKFMSSSIMEN